MRILFVADDLYPGFGGQASATQGHIAALLEAGHEVRAVAGAEPSPIAAPPGVLVERLPSWVLGNSQTRFAHPLFGRVAPHLEWADVMHANTPTALAAAAVIVAKRKSVPVVLGLHTQIETTELQVPMVGKFLGLLLRIWYRILFSGADLVVAPTRFAADKARAFTRSRVEAVSNGIDLGSWPEPTDLEERGCRLADPDAPRRLLYLGRLSGEKGVGGLLPLIGALRQNYRLTVAGHGPLKQELKTAIEIAGLEGRVDLLGFVSEEQKRALMASSDLFVMPSPAELQSIATLEAMAAGLPVVAFGHASSAVPGFVQDSGGGVVVNPVEPRLQARVIEELLDDPAAVVTTSRAARAFAVSHDVKASAARLSGLYQELIDARRVLRQGPAAVGSE